MSKDLIKYIIIKWLNTESIVLTIIFLIYMSFPIYFVFVNKINNEILSLSIILFISYSCAVGFIKMLNIISPQKRCDAIEKINNLKNK